MSEKRPEQEAAAFDDFELEKLEAEALGDIKEEAAAVGDVAATMQAPQIDEEMRGLVLGLLGGGFAVLAPNWQVRQEEVEQLSDAYTSLLCKYCPDGLGDYGVEISAVMMTLAIVAPRIGVPRIEVTRPEAAQTVPDTLESTAA